MSTEKNSLSNDPDSREKKSSKLADFLDVREIILRMQRVMARGSMPIPPGKYRLCNNCGFTGRRKTETRGSILIELVLWLCLIVPGLIYSIWRMTTRYSVCPKCDNRLMIPTNSPKYKELTTK